MSQIDPRGGVSIFQISVKFKKVSNKELPRNVTSSIDGMMEELTSNAELEKDIDFSTRIGKEQAGVKSCQAQ